MGVMYVIKCAKCGYKLYVTEGVGMMASSPNAVFYGKPSGNKQRWSVAFPDGLYEYGKPLLLDLVESKSIKDRAFALIKSGAEPETYGHELYICPKCKRLANLFYFKLKSPTQEYEPDYHCLHCQSSLLMVSLRERKDGKIKLIYKDNQNGEWRCPECGAENFEFTEGGFAGDWD
jgi:predicted nucleic-acid-binding Zn-ribbon protein